MLSGSPRSQKAARGFFIHLAVYALVNALLAGINLSSSPGHLWFFWPLLGWGVGVAAHAAAVFALPGRTAGAR